MWGNYGRILAEYPYVSSFRKKGWKNISILKVEKI